MVAIATVRAPAGRSRRSAPSSPATPTAPATKKAAMRAGSTPTPHWLLANQPAKPPIVT
jgi:hypothetical protein